MKRWLVLALVFVLAIGGGVGAGLLASARGMVCLRSASARGHTERLESCIRICDVLNLNECQNPRTQGDLGHVGNPIQLSVPEISRAPWRLLRIYENVADSTVAPYRPVPLR